MATTAHTRMKMRTRNTTDRIVDRSFAIASSVAVSPKNVNVLRDVLVATEGTGIFEGLLVASVVVSGESVGVVPLVSDGVVCVVTVVSCGGVGMVIVVPGCGVSLVMVVSGRGVGVVMMVSCGQVGPAP